jgi:polysaccharide export outer membrane protein
MRKTFPVKITAFFFIAGFALAGEAVAQSEQPTVKKVNFGYSQNPKTKSKSVDAEKTNRTEVVPTTEVPNIIETKTVEPTTIEPTNFGGETVTTNNVEFESRSVANKTLEVVKRANTLAVSPTEIYKIGVGDVLFISLQNASAKDSTYFTVLNDGTIDYPLAGEMIQVGGLTAEEIEDLLKTKIKLYEKPQVSVKVREHASHRITVLGLVEKAGEKFLPREAVPLFMIRAEAIVQPRANLALIKRFNSETERVDLNDSKSDEVLIFPGDIIEFKSSDVTVTDSSAAQFYFIGGNVVSGGQKSFHQGLTLTQAILASGGLKKTTVKKVVLRRKNQEGLLSALEFDLNSIKAGKQPDPLLHPGDTIEVVN